MSSGGQTHLNIDLFPQLSHCSFNDGGARFRCAAHGLPVAVFVHEEDGLPGEVLHFCNEIEVLHFCNEIGRGGGLLVRGERKYEDA